MDSGVACTVGIEEIDKSSSLYGWGAIWVHSVCVCFYLQVSMGTIHASFGSFNDAREKVLANRGGVCFMFLLGTDDIDGNCLPSNDGCWGATLIHTSTRRSPHALNLLRQVDIIEKAGGPGVQQQLQDSGQCKRNITVWETLLNLFTATGTDNISLFINVYFYWLLRFWYLTSKDMQSRMFFVVLIPVGCVADSCAVYSPPAPCYFFLFQHCKLWPSPGLGVCIQTCGCFPNRKIWSSGSLQLEKGCSPQRSRSASSSSRMSWYGEVTYPWALGQRSP